MYINMYWNWSDTVESNGIHLLYPCNNKLYETGKKSKGLYFFVSNPLQLLYEDFSHAYELTFLVWNSNALNLISTYFSFLKVSSLTLSTTGNFFLWSLIIWAMLRLINLNMLWSHLIPTYCIQGNIRSHFIFALVASGQI